MTKLFHLLTTALSHQQNFPAELSSYLPRSYKRVGHIAIINLADQLLDYKIVVGEALLELLQPSIKTIARFAKAIDGITRKPSVEWLAGYKNFETIHVEHGTKYLINPQQLMLSAGNHFERRRMIDFLSNLTLPKIVVLDMFACIGNLSLPFLVHLSNCSCVFLEINPVAVKYLKKSLEENRIEPNRFTIYEGDNHVTCPSNLADVVIMGYFGIDDQQLVNALNSLRSDASDGWFFIHDIGSLESESTVCNNFLTLLQKNDRWNLASVDKHVVKSIGPSFEHWVFDVHVIKKN